MLIITQMSTQTSMEYNCSQMFLISIVINLCLGLPLSMIKTSQKRWPPQKVASFMSHRKSRKSPSNSWSCNRSRNLFKSWPNDLWNLRHSAAAIFLLVLTGVALADPGVTADVCPPPTGSNSFVFACVFCQKAYVSESARPQWKILDPPLSGEPGFQVPLDPLLWRICTANME